MLSALIFPASRSLDSLFSTSFWIRRLTGLAPYWGSYPFWARYSIASAVASMVMFWSDNIFFNSSNWRPTISVMFDLLKGENMMISSILFRNSGLMVFLSSSMTSAWAASAALSISSAFSNFSWMIWLPILLVMMMIEFLKSATRPLLSVSRPSSRTWRRMLKVSGWAFSISSNRITE